MIPRVEEEKRGGRITRIQAFHFSFSAGKSRLHPREQTKAAENAICDGREPGGRQLGECE